MTNPSYVSTAVYAEAAGVTERTVRDRIDRGELEATQGAAGAPWRIPWAVYRAVAGEAPAAPVLAPTGRERPWAQRLGMGAIRAMYNVGFGALGFAIVYVADNFTSLGIPLWMGLPLGAFCYGLKRYVKPDGAW